MMLRRFVVPSKSFSSTINPLKLWITLSLCLVDVFYNYYRTLTLHQLIKYRFDKGLTFVIYSGHTKNPLILPREGDREEDLRQQKSITTADLEDTNSNAFCMKNPASRFKEARVSCALR